jgi:subtilisin family serine protease
MDLSVIESYNDISFNTDTKFPESSAKLPKDFEPEYILEFNKNPGLGIRDLHKQGITGAGISIAVIDQNLLNDHEQYKDNLMYYEKIHCTGDTAQMHGPAVASIAVGKDIGVAPEAKLYYIATTFGHFLEDGNFELDISILADCILRILDINKNLPESEKIRVISISRGYGASDKGYKEITEAIDKANEENVFVITTSTEEYYKNFDLFGMGRDYLASADDFKSYEPASWVQNELYSSGSNQWYENLTLFPMGSRTYAGCTGNQKYEIVHSGGLSWAVPWCAGFYALCCQVKPDITPQEFIDAVNSTAVPAESVRDGKSYLFGNIVNPAEVIKFLQK